MQQADSSGGESQMEELRGNIVKLIQEKSETAAEFEQSLCALTDITMWLEKTARSTRAIGQGNLRDKFVEVFFAATGNRYYRS